MFVCLFGWLVGRLVGLRVLVCLFALACFANYYIYVLYIENILFTHKCNNVKFVPYAQLFAQGPPSRRSEVTNKGRPDAGEAKQGREQMRSERWGGKTETKQNETK